MSLASGSVADEQRAAAPGTEVPAVVPAFDGFRGAAAMLIVVYHCWLLSGSPSFGAGPVQALFSGANLGVDMFFVISGFVLFLPMARNLSFGSTRAYALRRAARIIPAYYVVIAFVLVFWNEITLPLPAFVHPFDDSDGIVAVFSQLTFMQNVVVGGPLGRIVGYDTARSIVPLAVTWSLTVEICFYLVLPLIARRFLRRPLMWLAGCLVLALAWRFMCLHLGRVAEIFGAAPSERVIFGLRHQLLAQLPAFAGHFALGMTLAWALVRSYTADSPLRRLRAPMVAYRALALSAMATVVTWWWWGHDTMQFGYARGSLLEAEGRVGTAVLSQLAFAAAFTAFAGCVVMGPPGTRWLWTTRVARWLGDVSYGVFLWHFVALFFIVYNLRLRADGPDEKFIGYFLVATTIALGMASLSRRFVEQPVIGWARRTSARWNNRSATAMQPISPAPA